MSRMAWGLTLATLCLSMSACSEAEVALDDPITACRAALQVKDAELLRYDIASEGADGWLVDARRGAAAGAADYRCNVQRRGEELVVLGVSFPAR